MKKLNVTEKLETLQKRCSTRIIAEWTSDKSLK